MKRNALTLTEEDLLDLHAALRPAIEKRLGEFRRLWEEGTDNELFVEMVFCLLTPQSSAERSWKAVCGLRDSGLLYHGGFGELRDRLRSVRFMNNKAVNVIRSRETFVDGGISIRRELAAAGDDVSMREWLVRTVRGLGMKEATHYLRNIGHGGSLAILDRHILRRLMEFGVIGEIPGSLSARKYREIELRYMDFAASLRVEPLHLDLVLWYATTGEIFK